MSDVSARTLIFGFGYLGSRVAKLSIQEGDEVHATTRHPEKLDLLARAGTRPILADWTDRRTLANLPEVTAPAVVQRLIEWLEQTIDNGDENGAAPVAVPGCSGAL